VKIKESIEKIIGIIFNNIGKFKLVYQIIFGVFIGILSTYLYTHQIFEKIELLTLDRRFRLRPRIESSPQIIHVDMSEDSIQAIGRWPWPRSWHAAITSILSEYKPKMIIYDVVFSEKETEENDLVFEEAIKQAGNVYLGLLYNTATTDYRDLYKGGGIKSVLFPLERLSAAAKGIGHLNAMPDTDGTIRRIPPVVEYKGKKTFHISIRSSLDLLGVKEDDVRLNSENNILEIKNKDGKLIQIPLDRDNQLIINWIDKWGKEFKHFSYIDVITSYNSIKEGKAPIIDLNIFKDKILLIGLTASALVDIKPTPIQNAYPAVGANAAVVNSFITGDFIKMHKAKDEIFIIFALSILVSLLLFRVRPINGMMLTILIVISYITLATMTFNIYKTWVTIAYPVGSVLISYVLIALYTQVAATVERNKLFKQATRDGLTNLYNVRHFNLLIEAEFRMLKLNPNKKAAVIMSDIDNFKKINDTHGHQVGDLILKEIAKIFQSSVRQVDIVARYGGEEFVVLLPGAGKKDATDVAERIRVSVENKKFKFGDNFYTATVSFGVNEYTNDATKDDIIRKADEALYKAKTTGKNRVVIA